MTHIQHHDQPEDLLPATVNPLSSLEGVYKEDGCLIGVTMRGDNGECVTIICPDVDGYASAIREIL